MDPYIKLAIAWMALVLAFILGSPVHGVQLREISGADNLKAYWPFRSTLDNTFGAVPSGGDTTHAVTTGEGSPAIVDGNHLHCDANEMLYFTNSANDLFDPTTYTIWIRLRVGAASVHNRVLWFSTSATDTSSDDYFILQTINSGGFKFRHWLNDDASNNFQKHPNLVYGTATWYWIMCTKEGDGTASVDHKSEVWSDDNGRVNAQLGVHNETNDTIFDFTCLTLHFGGDTSGELETDIDGIWIYSDYEHGPPR